MKVREVEGACEEVSEVKCAETGLWALLYMAFEKWGVDCIEFYVEKVIAYFEDIM